MKDKLLSTGSLRFDLALKPGGIPRGEIILIRGHAESGKTSLCLMLAAAVTQQGENVAWIDADGQCDPQQAIALKVDPDHFFLHQVDALVPTLEMIELLLTSQAISLLVIDSLTIMLGKELESNNGLPNQVSEQAERYFTKRLPDLAKLSLQTGSVLAITERTQLKPRTVYHRLKGHLDRLALPLHAGIRINTLGVNPIIKNDMGQGMHLKIRMLRGKLVHSVSPIEIVLMYNEGVTKNAEIFEMAVENQLLLKQAGIWVYKGQPMGSNREKILHFFQKHPEVAQEIEQDIRERQKRTFHLVK